MKTKLNLKNNQGMTLIELTVVILVLLSLISVLFIGAKAWKEGSDHANCVMNIRNLQTGGRSYGNLDPTNAPATANVDKAAIYTFMGITSGYLCPTTKLDNYTAAAGATYGSDPGTIFFTCPNGTSASNNHTPSVGQAANW